MRGWRGWLLVLLVSLGGCDSGSSRKADVSNLESAFLRVLDARDQLEVTRSRGASQSLAGRSLADLEAEYAAALADARRQLNRVAESGMAPDQQKAFETIKRRLDAFPDPGTAETEASGESQRCDLSPETMESIGDDLDRLLDALYNCFGEKAHHLELDGEQLDRLTILERLSREEDRTRRKALFYALEPLWVTIHPRGKESPFRRMLQLSSREHRDAGTSIESAATRLGIDASDVEPWLTAILEAWSQTYGGQSLEPWDYYFEGGEASRRLAGAVSVEVLEPINDRFYQALGANPADLGIHYDLAPREGKDPVAFTTFGLRNRQINGKWQIGEFWVFATYREGGLGNLAELLHETGHGVHLAAIRTRPAYEHWPDSDIFTEAVADLAAWDAYEPEWQEDYLGESAPRDVSMRARYSALMLDVAWALFEIYLHRAPEREPNEVWTEITSKYLGIVPHPEISWWAIRGQLVSLPGYMLNYALGSILVADARQEITRRLRGRTQSDWYSVVSEGLFRYGLEKPSQEAVQQFLGRRPNPDALLASIRGSPPER